MSVGCLPAALEEEAAAALCPPQWRGVAARPQPAVMAVVLYSISLSGRALAHDEMRELAQMVDTTIES